MCWILWSCSALAVEQTVTKLPLKTHQQLVVKKIDIAENELREKRFMWKHRPEKIENHCLRNPEDSVAVQCLFNTTTFRYKTLRAFQQQEFLHGSSYSYSNVKVKPPLYPPPNLVSIFSLVYACTRDAGPVE